MGYTTEFNGNFQLDRPLLPEHAAYLQQFAETRRMKRDAGRAEAMLLDPIRIAAGLPIGEEGGYFVGGRGSFGQEDDASVVDYNEPPKGQPSQWCQWVPTADLQGIEWDGQEKFYSYEEWLTYIIEHFLKPWGYILNGEVEWAGEDPGDLGKLRVTDNAVSSHKGRVVYD